MRPFVETLILACLLSPWPAVADRVLQECQTVESSSPTIPALVRDYMRSNSQTVIRLCKQIDFGTETYDALGAVTKTGDVCRYTRVQISPLAGDATEPSQYLAWAPSACPRHESPRYVLAANISQTDFVSIYRFFEHIASSPQAFSSAIADLPDAQQESAELSSLGRQINRTGGVRILRVFQWQSFLGIRSVFQVDIADADNDASFYAFRVRDLFGELSLMEFSKGHH
jgi:hypothetical protein